MQSFMRMGRKKKVTYCFKIKASTKALITLNTDLEAYKKDGEPREVSKARLERISTAGFRGLTSVEAEINNELVQMIIQRYDATMGKILYDNKIIPINEDDVVRVYGLPNGPLEITLVEEFRDEIHQFKQTFKVSGDSSLIKINELKNLMKDCEDPQNYACLYILFALGYFYAPKATTPLALNM